MALNLGREPLLASVSSGKLEGIVALSSGADREGECVGGDIALRPNEGLVIELDPRSEVP